MKRLDDAYLTLECFEKNLGTYLKVKSYPSENRQYYECVHFSAELEPRLINIYIV